MSGFIDRFRERLWSLEDRLTVRQQIGIGAALLVVLLVAALAAAAASMSYRQVSDLLTGQLRDVARTMTDRLDRYMVVRQRQLVLFAGLADVGATARSDPAELRRLLEQLQKSFADFTWIGFADPDGKVLAATGGLLQGASVKERPWFINGKLNLTIEDVHEAKLLATLLPQRAAGETYRFVDIAAPIRTPEGHLLGVLGGHLDWDWARELAESMDGEDARNSRTQIWILAKDGTILLGPEVGSKYFSPEQVKAMHEARTGTFLDERGAEATLTAYGVSEGYADFPGLQWIVLARRPAEIAYAAASGNAWGIIFIGAVIGTIGMGIGMLMAGRIARPVQAMTKEADRIGRTSATTTFARQRGSREAIQLTRALRSLLRRIGFAEERRREAELRATTNAQQFQEDVSRLRKLAETDSLTNLLNRRVFLAAATDAMNYSKRYKRSIAALMIDIDHFKKVNDTFGHGAGDGVIKRVAELIEDCVRTTDKAGRFGGEEFVILLREVDLDQAKELAERIRATVEASVITYGSSELKVTVSIGVAIVAESDRDVADLVERADQGLYLAKNTGRNRVFSMPLSNMPLERVA